MKTCDWLNKLETAPDDQVISVTFGDNDVRMILSHDQGIAVTLSPTKAATQPVVTAPASIVMTPREFGIVSSAGRRKYVAHPLSAHFVATLNIVPTTDQPGGKRRQNFSVNAGFDTKTDPTAKPFRLRVAAAPVSFLHAAHPEKGTAEVKAGVLTITSAEQLIRIDAATGKLLQFTNGPGRYSATVTSGTGAMDAEIKALEASSPNNEYDAKHPIGSFCAFVAERLGSGDYFATRATPAQRKSLATAVQKIVTPALFAPLDEMQEIAPPSDLERFRLPVNPDRVIANGPLGQIALLGIPWCNRVFVRGTWPWTFARESLNVLSGNTQYGNREVARLYGADDIGPIGYAAGAKLLTVVDPQLAKAFAQKGLESLTVESFQKDCRVLLLSDSAACRVLAQFVANIRQLNDEEVAAINEVVNPIIGGVVTTVAQNLRTAPQGVTAQGLADALGALWNTGLKPKVEAALRAIADGADRPDGKL